MSLLYLTIIFQIFHSISAQVTVTTPTSGNATHQYFDTSTTILYTSDSIICATSYCHIICDEPNGCYDANIDASSSDTLIVECLSTSSCENFNITAGPTTDLNVYCKGDSKSCKYGNIKALTTTNIYVFCNDTNTNLATACMYLKVITAQASTLNMDCVSSHSCFQAGIVANTMNGNVNLVCSGDNACDQLKVGATNMGSSSVVHVLCDTGSNITQACETTFIECPVEGTCNIDCISPGGCYNTQITIPNDAYRGLNLYCADTFADDSCITSDFVCSDTTQTSQLIYDATYSRWTCETYGCCPFKDGDPQSCGLGTDCEIYCNTGANCKNSIINGSLANSLTVNCIGTKCDGSLILCPFGDNTACTIMCNGTAGTPTGGPCDEALIQVGNGNMMDSFSIFCDYYGGAYDEQGCTRTRVEFNAASITDVIVDATGHSDARYMTFKGDAIIGNFKIDCEECEYSTFDLKISKSVVASCKWGNACYRMESSFTSMSEDVDYLIDCNNLDGSQYNKACAYTKWWFHGYNDTANNNQRNNNVTVNCAPYDCYATSLFGYSLFNADVDCIGKPDSESSCWYGTMDFATTESFNLNCVGYWTCRETDIYCPYSDPNSCHITCDDSSLAHGAYGSCHDMQIHVPDSYTWDYLDLNCAASGVCGDLAVNCNQGGSTPVVRAQAVYIWDATSMDYQCTDDGATFCCPYYNTTAEIGGCAPDADCIVDCASSSCSGEIIDGSKASYLNVSCGAQKCQNTVIHCPVGGCNVFCNDTRACEYASIVYGGTMNDMNRGKVVITCEGYYSCHQTLMDMNFVDELVLNCNGDPSKADRICYGINFEANYANKVTINAYERYAMEDESYNRYLYMRHAGAITINAKGLRALSDHYIYAQDAGSMEFNLAADGTISWPIYNNDIYLPRNTTFNCYGYGCRDLGDLNLNGANADGLTINLDTCEVCDGVTDCIYKFNLYCDSTHTKRDYFTYGTCDSNQCGCEDVMNAITVTTVYEEENCYTPRSIQTCTGSCTFTCNAASSNNCADYILDGTGANSMTVNCGDSYYCQDTIVYCPLNGCTVTCDAANACNGALVIYDGTIPDAGVVEINCNAWTNACYDMKWNAPNAKSVIINGIGADSMVSSILRADHAEAVTVTLSADSGTSAVQSMQWYVPQTTTFNCFGTGCSNLEDINRGSISTATGFQMNVVSCAQCTSAKACLQGFNLTCNAGIDLFTPHDPCTNDNMCGCSDIVSNNVAFTSSYGDSGCLSNPTVQTCQSNKDCVVDCATSTCANEVIDGQSASSLTVHCENNGYCAGVFIHCPSVGCDIRCMSSSGSACTNTKILYDGLPTDDGLVKLECDGRPACHSMIVNAENAASMQLFLVSNINYYASYAVQWYLAQNTTFHCFGTGCVNLNEIYRGDTASATGLSFHIETCNQCDTMGECLNSFDLNCMDGEDVFDSGLCKDRATDNTCGCSDVIRNDTQFTRTYQGARCSYSKPIDVCAIGVPCVMNCDTVDGNCTNKVIDAKLATHLSVYCGAEQFCQSAIFECPIAGCSVVCNASNACYSAKVIYDGQIADTGSVEVECITQNACQYLSITAPEAYQIDLTCSGEVGVYNYACRYLELNADFANRVSIRVSEQHSSYRDVWNVRYAKEVIFDARGAGTSAYVLYYGDLFANDAEYVEINLASDLSNTYVPHYTNWYIPRNTTFNCFGYGCYNLYELWRGDITTAEGLQFNVDTCGVCANIGDCVYDYDLNCVVGGSTTYDNYRGSTLCSSYNNCGCRDAMSVATITTDYREQRCFTPRVIQSCTADIACVMDCDVTAGTCQNQVMDGSLASSLSVRCTDDYHCQNAVIYCPDEGCDILCNSTYACDGMKVIYEGQTVDNGVINIECDGQYACRYMEVDADAANSIDITCRGNGIDITCYVFVLNANNANQVAISAYDGMQSNYAAWNVQNVTAFTITGRGQNAIYYSNIEAENAGNVEINLIGDGAFPAAANTNWYLPHNNTVFNCYGKACYNLHNIYRGSTTDATGLDIHVETCGQCNDINDCLYSFTMFCNAGQDSFVTDHCASENLCGCSDLVQNNIHIAATYGEPQCYSPFTRTPTTAIPTAVPTGVTSDPTTHDPTSTPTTSNPTASPSAGPTTLNPTSHPSATPSAAPTTPDPTAAPTTSDPTRGPIIGTRGPTTSTPTSAPTTSDPTSAPTTSEPTPTPSDGPTTPFPTAAPIIGTRGPTTSDPTSAPTTSDPTVSPLPGSLNPTAAPTTSDPTSGPVVNPTSNPSESPTSNPSASPTEPTASPTYPYRSSWHVSDHSFSWSDYGTFAGYDDVYGRIWVFGGYSRGFVSNRENIMYYDIYGDRMVNMSDTVGGYNQFSFSRAGTNVAVVDRTLYFMRNTRYNAERVMSFNMDTFEFNDAVTDSLPITSAGESPCTTAYDNKLYFVCGANDVRFYGYDLIKKQWITGRDMTESRTYCSCAIVNGYLYIWNGGVTTVQKTNVNALEFPWITVATVPTFNTVGMASIVDKYAIYAIGGYRSDSIKARDTVYVIDTRDDTVIDYTQLLDLQLPSDLSRGYHQAVFAHNTEGRIYLVQGVHPAASTNTLIYSDYIVTPTDQPTRQPTVSTSDPTTHAPTSLTLNPTTNAPTLPTSSPEISIVEETEQATESTLQAPEDVAASRLLFWFALLLLHTFFVFFV